MLADVLVRSAWPVLARGATAGILGILVLSWPHLALGALALVFGIYTLLDGGVMVIAASLCRKISADRRLLGVQALASIAIGLIVLGHPGITASYLVLQIALRTVAVGGMDSLSGLVLLEQPGSGWRLPILCGTVPALVSALVLVRLGTDAQAAHWYLAISSLVASMLFLALALRWLMSPAQL